jgi:SOS response regulatory protein OraA/RecX
MSFDKGIKSQPLPGSCKKDALKLLSRKGYHSQELARKLRAKGHSSQEIVEAIEEMIRLRYVNDAEYMESFRRKAEKKGWNAYTMRGKLYQKGIIINDSLIDD